MSARVLTGGGDSSLETQIDAVTGKLVELLDEQRKKERTTNQSFWPSCEAAGEGYVGCNPLKHGECPEEAEFATTFVDKPFANTWSKDPVSGDMIRCIPAWMKGKATAKKPVEKDLTRRVLSALIQIEENYPKAAKDAEFQWNTPCSDAQNLHQCEIMRNPPSYNAEGQLEYADHGTRCMWRPLEDTDQFLKDYENDNQTAKCIARFDHPYQTEPLTLAELDRIKGKIKEAREQEDGGEFSDPHLEEMTEVSTPYGRARVRTTDKLRDLQDAIVTLPVLPTAATIRKLDTTFATKPVDQGGIKDTFFQRELSDNGDGDDPDQQINKMYFDIGGAFPDGITDYSNVNAAIKKLTESCNTDTKESRVWHPSNMDQGMGRWLVPQDVANAKDDDNTQQTKLKKLIADAAQTSWWQFAVQNLKAQDDWRRAMEVLSRRLASELKDDDSRKALELSLTPMVGAADKDSAEVDMSLVNLQGTTLNTDLFGTGSDIERFLGENNSTLHKIRFRKSEIRGAQPLHKRLQSTPILKFDMPYEGADDAAKAGHWNRMGMNLAMLLWGSSTIDPSNVQNSKEGLLRTLHRRGIGTHKWKNNISGKVKVTSVDSYLSPSEKSHAQSILRSLKRLKKRQLGERLNSSIVKEVASKIQNRATNAYFSTLNAEHDVEERYRLAVAQIPKMLQWKFDKDKLIQFTQDEIKRRFHNTPGHVLYYNRTGAGGDLRTEAARKLVALAEEKLEAVKKNVKDDQDTAELRKALEEYRNVLKESTTNKIAHKDLNAQFAQTFEDKFGPGTFIHPITGATTKQLVSMAKV